MIPRKTRIVAMTLVLVAGVAVAHAQRPDEERIKNRQRISMMEGTLERAVSNGADNLLRKLRTVGTDMPLLTGVPEVRGFRLDGYGVFFDVEVPGLRLPMTWPLQLMVMEQSDLGDLVLELRALGGEMEGPQRDRLRQVVTRLERRVRRPLSPTEPAGVAIAQGAPAGPSGVDRALIDDPTEGYTREVEAALVDAMLENSGPLGLEPGEWLTVAARDNLPRDPLSAGGAEFSTLVFRVKGDDLSAFRSGRLTLQQARQRVERLEH